MNNIVLDCLDLELAEILVKTLDMILDSLIEKQEREIYVKDFIEVHLYEIFKMVFRAHGVFLNFKLVGKLEP